MRVFVQKAQLNTNSGKSPLMKWQLYHLRKSRHSCKKCLEELRLPGHIHFQATWQRILRKY